MKILLVTESYWPNADGAALFERRLIHGEIGLGNKGVVWAAGSKAHSFIETDGDCPIYREKALRFVFNRKYKVSFWPWWSARRVIRAVRPDVIHINNAYFMGLAALWWAKRYRIPVVATNHFMPENALLNLHGVNWLYQPLEKLIWSYLVWFHNRCNFVTSPTPTAVQLLVDHGLRVPHEAITNGIDMVVFKPQPVPRELVTKLHLATDRPILLYVGRVDGEKRLDLIVSALPEILAAAPVQLVIAGYGIAMDRLKAQAKSLGVSENIVFTGYLDEADKPLIYNAAAVFVISSPAELQSIVTLEAMASGLPILSVDVAALKELCHDGVNGYLFPRDDFKALADKAILLLKDNGLRKRFGAESINIVRASHATEVTFKAYESAYNKAMKGN